MMIFLAVVLVATYVLHFTVFGRYVYAIGGTATRPSTRGSTSSASRTSTYVISSFLGGVAARVLRGVHRADEPAGHRLNCTIAAAVLGGVSLREARTVLGIIIGSAVMHAIDNGINMFQVLYTDDRGIRRIWRLDPNWTFVIIGTVILVAVVLDQVVHMVQAAAAPAAPAAQPATARRRGRRADPADGQPRRPSLIRSASGRHGSGTE